MVKGRNRFRLRVMAGALVGAGVGLCSPLLLGLPDVRAMPEAGKLVAAILGSLIAIPGWPLAGRGALTLAVIVLFWATLGAVVVARIGARPAFEGDGRKKSDANAAQE
jgi:hypothetical protein